PPPVSASRTGSACRRPPSSIPRSTTRSSERLGDGGRRERSRFGGQLEVALDGPVEAVAHTGLGSVDSSRSVEGVPDGARERGGRGPALRRGARAVVGDRPRSGSGDEPRTGGRQWRGAG